MEKEAIVRKQLLEEINYLIQCYCDGCFLYRQNVLDSGKRKSHKFCISECTVGGQIRELGCRLQGNPVEEK
ncbi:zinc-finger domain-containing protein [Neobacillus sp. YIM B06451]|uniref:zinc-finger domain-containing protein n=1 Tax=Neobacillus sp. YIM B06451 TaxID=3070994 RepID=UPI00292DA84F|nr:zinc-finger domain-containing protein [Neobacillus sp. YIM B06451]